MYLVQRVLAGSLVALGIGLIGFGVKVWLETED